MYKSFEFLYFLNKGESFLYTIYYEGSNQQNATTFPFINLFKSALHVSGDKFAHPQEHFRLYTQLLVQ